MGLNIAMVKKFILNAEMQLNQLDSEDGKRDGKISGSIWNKANPNAQIDENGFKNLDEALAEKRAEILEKYNVTEEDIQKYDEYWQSDEGKQRKEEALEHQKREEFKNGFGLS